MKKYNFLLNIKNNFDIYLLLSIFISLVFFPSFNINNTYFVGIEEFLIVFATIRLFLIKKNINEFKLYYVIGIIFLFYILFTILINKENSFLSNYFECYKLLKFFVLILYTNSVLTYNKINLKSTVIYSFIFLVFLNILHYFDVLSLNKYLFIFYDTDGRDILNFGKDSLGNIDTKRMVGTMGNPNINSILFLFYSSFFIYLSISNKIKKLYEHLCLILSFCGVILCQSKTGIFILLLLIILYLIYDYKSFKIKIIQLLSVLLIISLILYKEKKSLNYVKNAVENINTNNSIISRIDTWKFMINEIKEDFLFGKGPSKEFIYSNNIYPENEFLLVVFRYGIIGLFFYLFILLYPLIKTKKIYNNLYLYVCLVILISATTNCPLSDVKINLISAILIGICFTSISNISNLKINAKNF